VILGIFFAALVLLCFKFTKKKNAKIIKIQGRQVFECQEAARLRPLELCMPVGFSRFSAIKIARTQRAFALVGACGGAWPERLGLHFVSPNTLPALVCL
jgi:hypothetical protein